MFDKKIHFISLMQDVAGGNEWETLALAELLKDHANTEIWSKCAPHHVFAARSSIKHLRPRHLCFPLRGTFVFNGVYFSYGRWLHLALPRRVVVICNTYHPRRLRKRLNELSKLKNSPRVELVYVSEVLRQKIGRSGFIQHSPIDVRRFAPAESEPANSACDRDIFTIGRLSRDVRNKHHVPDLALYRRLLAAGCDVRIMGGTCLREDVPEVEGGLKQAKGNLKLLPTGSEEASTFLQKLDCFYYRTGKDWFEGFGRVVAEAMACEVPVVCHDRGGYTELIDHGRNGFLFDTQEEAFEMLMRLKNDSQLCASVGAAARQTVKKRCGLNGQKERLVDFYTR